MPSDQIFALSSRFAIFFYTMSELKEAIVASDLCFWASATSTEFTEIQTKKNVSIKQGQYVYVAV